MRFSVVAGLGLAAASISVPALAGHVTYLGLRGSYAITEDTQADAPGFGGEISFDSSFAGSGLVGMFLSPDVRIEAELMYEHSEADSFSVRQDAVNLVPLTGQTFLLTGDTDVIAPMLNLILELPIEGTSIDLYGGAGIGGAYLNLNATSAAAGVAIDDDAWALAYQFLAGATAPIADGVEAQLGYRYFTTTDFTANDPVLGNFDMDVTSHHIEFGLLFRL